MTSIDTNSPSALWRSIQEVDNWLAVSPTSSISEMIDLSIVNERAEGRLDEFVEDGYGTVRLLPLDAAVAARSCISNVVAAGIPPVFAYVYDEVWALLPPLLGFVADRIGSCAALDDGWAWHLAPGAGAGWPGHRGSCASGAKRGTPQVVNTWLALTDVTERHSTIVLVPTSADPYFPGSLDQHPTIGLGRLITARTGEAIYWDARVFHWGSESLSDADGPRISVSFTIVSDDFDPTEQRIGRELPGLDHRLQLIAGWIQTYGHLDDGITPAVAEWARLWRAAGREVNGALR